ncbi:coiled-coil domain-containing protein 96-like isoform X2 [Diabrotica virgifera virgifera]|uniref:CCDC113/CCDC96 coiled-coil domain-containing protein n=1 Tax=Diabrotica virgifera virgifera TaxID=50390 RepID=A0ABM5L8B7_DIAVI|nr:coiled-coil domain-containing protein 96-like isoform X2 [Diabrotica virgifera virgifera]
MTEESQKIDLDASGSKPSVNESDDSSKLADKGNVLDDGKLQTDVEVEERNNTHLEKKSLDSKELTEKSATSSISSSKLFKSSEKKSIDSKEIIEKSAKLSISSSKLFKSSEKKSLGSKEIIEESATSSISSSKLFKSSEKKSINSKEVTEKTAKLSISSSKLFKSSEKKSLGSKEIIEEPVTSSISSSKPFKSSEKNWLNSKEVTEETAKSSISSSKLLKSSMDVPSPDPKLSEEYGFDPTKSISLTFMDPPAYEFVKRGLLEEKDDDISGLFDNLDDQDAEQEEESLTEEEYHYEEKKRPRTSILSYTLKYDFDRRYDDSLDEHRFKEALTMEMKIPSLGMEMWEEEEEEEEEKEKVVEESLISEESESSLPRSVHVERYHLIAKQLNQSKVINLVLERKLALYFRRKKMPYVFIPEDLPDLAIKRYKRVLDNLDYLSTNATRQRENIINELSRLKHTKREKTIHLDQMFSDLQAREKEVAHGLINTKNGTEMTDEYVEHQLHRQQKNMEEKYKLMVKWIRLTKMVNEKEQAIKAVDKVDEGHYLTNFDKLKSENRLRADKIEEQERELMKYRKKSEETVQILAHIREKISALRSDIQDAIEEDAFLQRNRDVARSSLNDTKIERDRYKRLTKNLEEESGLLSHPHLVQDMKESEKEFEEKKRLLKDLRDGYRLSMKQTKNIRKLLEKREELLAARGSRLITKSSKRKFALHNASFYRQPGFFKPTLPSTILRDVLTDFQINVTKIEYPADSSVKSTKLHPYKGVKYYSAKNRYITSKGVKN